MPIRAILTSTLFLFIAAPNAQCQFDPTDPEPFFGGTRYEIAYPGFSEAGGGQIGAQSVYGNGKVTAIQELSTDPSNNDATRIDERVNHQPLIHVKVRVIEVDRRNSLSVASVLDYFGAGGATTSLTDGAPLNSTGRQRASGVTNFTIPGLITDAVTGSGALVNLTGNHINWVASLLATELNADVVNAPQVTTLNGKNVTFRSGSKVPFNIGSNVIQSSASTIQQVTYRHVGMYISVTPQIVNWGTNHEGRGQVRSDYATEQATHRLPVLSQDITDLHMCLLSLRGDAVLRERVRFLDETFYENYLVQVYSGPFDDSLRSATATILNGLMTEETMDRFQLSSLLNSSVAIPESGQCPACDWHAADCTVNLNIAVRLSDAGSFNPDGTSQREDDVRAIANVVQVKSGHGVVMGGLISMRDVEIASKVPVLGDLPLVGAAFRSKDNRRQKTETIIFVEAEVLPPLDLPEDSGFDTVKSITSRDYCNGQIHTQCDICNGFLADGMRRAGLAAHYLPPLNCNESEYWAKYERTVKHRKTSTQLFDTFKK